MQGTCNATRAVTLAQENLRVLFTIDVDEREGVTILQLRGDLGEPEGFELIARVNEALSDRGALAVIDMSGVSHMNSAGIASLVRVVAQANTQEQRVVLAGPTPLVAGVFAATRLDRFFEVFATTDDALRKIAN